MCDMRMRQAKLRMLGFLFFWEEVSLFCCLLKLVLYWTWLIAIPLRSRMNPEGPKVSVRR